MSACRSACVMAPYPPELLPNTPRRPSPPQPKRCSIVGSISLQQVVFPGTHRSRVDILVAAEAGEAVGKGNDNRRHAVFADQPVEPLRQVLLETDPVRVRQAAAGKANQVDEQRQSAPVLTGRNVYSDVTRRRVAEHVGLEHRAVDGDAADGSRWPGKLAHICSSLLRLIGPNAQRTASTSLPRR